MTNLIATINTKDPARYRNRRCFDTEDFIIFVLTHTLTYWQVTARRPATADGVTDAAKIRALCTTGRLDCADGDLALHTETNAVDGVHRDMSIHTINDLQRDFFLESALVTRGIMHLNNYLRDDAPKRPFLTSRAATRMPALTSSRALDLIQHFGVAPTSEMATAVATAAYLCGYGALPGEKMSCAASADAMATFVSGELGSHVKVLSTSNTPSSAGPAGKAPVTIVDVTKGSIAEGEKIVVCHVVNFPSALYYCHRVTGTKVIRVTLDAGNDSELIKAVGICHLDTSLWLSTHPAFNALNIPRGDEACHMLIDSDLVFVPTPNETKLE